MSETSNLVQKRVPNPSGKGGFGDRPETINRSGTWNPEMVFSHQYKRFMNMSSNDFKLFADVIKSGTCTMVEMGAWNRVKEMHKSLQDVKEITDRTEGRASQQVDVTTNGKDMPSPIIALTDVS